RDRTFAVSSVLMFFLGFILLGSTYLIPAFVQDLLGYTATDAGLVLTPGAVFLILMMPLVGRMQARVDVRWMIAFGLVTAGGALLWLARFDLTIDYGHIMLARIIQSIGLGFLFVPINTVAFSSLAEDKTSNASGLINLWRNLGGSVGISLASSLLARRAQLHQADLGPAFSLAHRPFDETYHRLAAYLSHLAQAGGGDRSLAALYQSLYAQARLMSYLDGFELFGLIFIAAVAVLLIMPRPKLSGGAAPVG
ncbi:MAG: MFS transporter, partial [Alphaproteobacteria bacterium]|nr:MFS transporter [Alphaproteobacteria bacterium]